MSRTSPLATTGCNSAKSEVAAAAVLAPRGSVPEVGMLEQVLSRLS